MEQNKEKKAAAKQAKESQRTPKPLEDMDLMDDFLFGSVVSYPEIGERFLKILLKTIFGREFKQLSVTAQKMLYGAGSDRHGARLDVYLEPEAVEEAGERAAVYDIEPDRNDKDADVRALPRRVRFYHGKIAARNLDSGQDYDALKDVFIIMITPYDPFGLGRMLYTVKSRCLEVPEMPYEDGANTLFLYTKGETGVPSEALRQLLQYMEDSVIEKAVNKELREIHRMVETVKRDPEVGGMRIRIFDDVIRLEEKVTRVTEEKAEITEKYEKATEKIAGLAEENARVTEEKAELEEKNVGLEEKVTRVTEEKVELAEKYESATEKIAKMAEEIIKLREKLDQRNTPLHGGTRH